MSSSESTIRVDRFVSNLRAFRYREVMMAVATLSVIAGAIVFFPGRENVSAGIQSDVSIGLLAAFVLVAIVAGIVKGMIGFGYALITTPIFASVIDPTFAVVVLAIPPWMINMFQIGETDTGLEFVREEWLLVALAVAGTVLGVAFLAEFSTGPIVPFLIGLIIFGYVVFQFVQNFVTVEEAHHPIALGTAGFLEGFLLAVANLGPLLPVYFHTFERDAERYIGGLSMVLGTVFTIRLVQMALFTDLLTTYRLWLGSVIAVVTIVGLLLGTYLRRLEVDEDLFNWFVVGLLFLISLNIFRNTVPALFF
ncbi:sulfite exporter TauE/SafE family protein [Natrinema sp. 1APR25-10V2]|uniref:sulfite exporter TauE/SafE family protein n=1 Tax=Natrinema sp. 1APR25-10V2 TaxID=2951081 RepID=UPI002875DACB|nr:sulfite exporter TauE/SafE family protein [Natrinema sp. 1APR25-10V2]MDS0474493.1 sulfite exporter TauE/SafE family protein [Natrinema sp. 1APR25-10V2]